MATVGYFSDTVDIDVPITDYDVHAWAKREPKKAAAVLLANPTPARTDALAKALEDWHNRDHPMAFRCCDHPVCAEANREHPNTWGIDD